MRRMTNRALSRVRAGRPVRPRTPIDHAALRAARVARDISGPELALLLRDRHALLLSVAALRNYERGRVSPPDSVRDALERVLGVSLAVRL